MDFLHACMQICSGHIQARYQAVLDISKQVRLPPQLPHTPHTPPYARALFAPPRVSSSTSSKGLILLALVLVVVDVVVELVLIVLDNAALDGLFKDVDFRGGKPSGANTPLEQEAQFGKEAVSGLRHTEICVDDAEEAATTPEEAGVVAPVPSRGVEHVWRENAAHYADYAVQVAAKHDDLYLQLARREFCHQGVAHRADRQLVEERPD